MKKKIILLFILLLLVFIGWFSFSSSERTNSQRPHSENEEVRGHTYFWSKTCPHCKNVNEFLLSWEGKDKIEIKKVEINESQKTKVLFLEAGEACNIPRNRLGVPLLVGPENQCFLGDTLIIDYFKNFQI